MSEQFSAGAEAPYADSPAPAVWSADSTCSAFPDQAPEFREQPNGVAAPAAGMQDHNWFDFVHTEGLHSHSPGVHGGERREPQPDGISSAADPAPANANVGDVDWFGSFRAEGLRPPISEAYHGERREPQREAAFSAAGHAAGGVQEDDWFGSVQVEDFRSPVHNAQNDERREVESQLDVAFPAVDLGPDIAAEATSLQTAPGYVTPPDTSMAFDTAEKPSAALEASNGDAPMPGFWSADSTCSPGADQPPEGQGQSTSSDTSVAVDTAEQLRAAVEACNDDSSMPGFSSADSSFPAPADPLTEGDASPSGNSPVFNGAEQSSAGDEAGGWAADSTFSAPEDQPPEIFEQPTGVAGPGAVPHDAQDAAMAALWPAESTCSAPAEPPPECDGSEQSSATVAAGDWSASSTFPAPADQPTEGQGQATSSDTTVAFDTAKQPSATVAAGDWSAGSTFAASAHQPPDLPEQPTGVAMSPAVPHGMHDDDWFGSVQAAGLHPPSSDAHDEESRGNIKGQELREVKPPPSVAVLGADLVSAEADVTRDDWFGSVRAEGLHAPINDAHAEERREAQPQTDEVTDIAGSIGDQARTNRVGAGDATPPVDSGAFDAPKESSAGVEASSADAQMAALWSANSTLTAPANQPTEGRGEATATDTSVALDTAEQPSGEVEAGEWMADSAFPAPSDQPTDGGESSSDNSLVSDAPEQLSASVVASGAGAPTAALWSADHAFSATADQPTEGDATPSDKSLVFDAPEQSSGGVEAPRTGDWSADSTFSAPADLPADFPGQPTGVVAPPAVQHDMQDHDWFGSAQSADLRPSIPDAPDEERREVEPQPGVTFWAVDLAPGIGDDASTRGSEATPTDDSLACDAPEQSSAGLGASWADHRSADSTFSVPAGPEPGSAVGRDSLNGAHDYQLVQPIRVADMHSSFSDSDVDWNEVEPPAPIVPCVADADYDVDDESEEFAFAEANDDITSVADNNESFAVNDGSLIRRRSLDAMLGPADETTPRDSSHSGDADVVSEASFADFGDVASQSFANDLAVLSVEAAGDQALRPSGQGHALEEVTTEARQPSFDASFDDAFCEETEYHGPSQARESLSPPPPPPLQQEKAASALAPVILSEPFKGKPPNSEVVGPPSLPPLASESITPESCMASPDVVFCGWSLKRGLFFYAQKFFVLTRDAELKWFESTSNAGQIKHRGTMNLSHGAAIQRVGGNNDYTFRLSAGGITIHINPQTKDAYAMWQEGLVRSCEEGLVARRNVSRTASAWQG